MTHSSQMKQYTIDMPLKHKRNNHKQRMRSRQFQTVNLHCAIKIQAHFGFINSTQVYE
jgi:hypothetical protein